MTVSAPPARTAQPARRLRARSIPQPAPTVVPRPAPRPPALEPVPRTSAQRPWDRVRFVGPTQRTTSQAQTDAAVGSSAEPPGLPEPEQWAAALVRAAVEALLGLRPTAQLARWLDQDLYEALTRRAILAGRVEGRAAVTRSTAIRRVRVCRVRDGVREATVVLHDGRRIRAAAVRLEVHRGRWRATALEIG